MTIPTQVDAVIVGAGPTGLTAANLLASYGVENILIIDAHAPRTVPRAILVDDESLRTLQACGLDLELRHADTTPCGRSERDLGVHLPGIGLLCDWPELLDRVEAEGFSPDEAIAVSEAKLESERAGSRHPVVMASEIEGRRAMPTC